MRSLYQFFGQFGNFLLFLVLEGICILLIVQFNENQRTIFNHTLLVVSGNIQERIQNVRDYFQLEETVEDLRIENAQLRKRLIQGPASSSAHPQDRKMSSDSCFTFIPGRVVSNQISGRHNRIIADRGTKDGVRPGMGVMGSNGIVGQVISCSNSYSSILPLINVQSSISASLERSDFFGQLEWDGSNWRLGQLKAIPKHADVVVDEAVITSGYSAIFPAGLRVGKVVEVQLPQGSNFYEVELEFAEDFSKLNSLYFIKNKDREELLGLDKMSVLYE